jgi:hypothetical protein
VLAGLKEFTLANNLYEASISAYRIVHGEESYEHVEALYRFSFFFFNQEHYGEAELLLVRLIALAERVEDFAKLERADFIEQHARVLLATGREEESALLLAQVKAMWEEAGTPRDDL